MLIENVKPTTMGGIKRLAAQYKKEKKIKHYDALDLAANAANFANFRHAQNTLPTPIKGRSKPYVLLTIYWRDEKPPYRSGRETLQIDLSVPILDLCKKSELKHVRGFGNLRLALDDHFVCDSVSPSQAYARGRLCTAERSLRFMEQTNLRPCCDYRKANPKVMENDKLPNIDHSTDWVDPTNGQYILIDEPYGNVPDEATRADWASRTGWRIIKTSWPGLYSPYDCDLYVATDNQTSYDLEGLAAKINAMPSPLIPENWNGESSSSWETFVSPMAQTQQDKRRARSKGTIYPASSATTIPYSYAMGSSSRRPIGELTVNGHQDAGRIIKATLASGLLSSGAWNRLNSLRSTLEDWLSLEIGRAQLDGPEFFDVYYRRTDRDEVYQTKMQTRSNIISALNILK